MAMLMRATPLPDRCANTACRNKPGEGKYVIVESDGNVVGGHRPLRLMMCAPCATALSRITGIVDVAE